MDDWDGGHTNMFCSFILANSLLEKSLAILDFWRIFLKKITHLIDLTFRSFYDANLLAWHYVLAHLIKVLSNNKHSKVHHSYLKKGCFNIFLFSVNYAYLSQWAKNGKIVQ